MVNELEKHFIFVVEDVEEDPITFQKSGALPADMEKHLRLKAILGEQKIFTEKESAKN